MGDTVIAPLKVIAGSGQLLALSGTTAAAFSAVGAQTRAVALALAPTATATGCTVTITHAGTAATTSTDLFIKTTDPPIIVGCGPGDIVNMKPLASCNAYLTELSH